MRCRIILLALLVVFCSAVGKADQLPLGDPIIKTGGNRNLARSGQAPAAAPIPIIVSNFTIFSKTGTSPGTSPCKLIQGSITLSSPNCLFENFITIDGVGQTITSLIFDAPTVPFGRQDKCDVLPGSPFALPCGVDPLPGGGTEFSFTNGSIPFRTDFTLDFEGFPANISFATTATTAIPEPATLTLFLSGLAAAFARRRAGPKT